jgi:hypothetical protein
MIKQAPSVGRILVMVGFALSCFGLLLYLWLAFGGPTPLKPKGYRFQTSFGEATQLAKEADVRISGVSVGKVKTIAPDKRTGRSEAVIELQPRYSPLPKDAKAILRQKTLLGETYVELTPDLFKGFKVVNYLLNELTYNPAGSEVGYMFWVAWANHAGNSIFQTQDAHGPVRHGTFQASCSTFATLDTVDTANPVLGTLDALLNRPRTADICPTTSQAPGIGGG